MTGVAFNSTPPPTVNVPPLPLLPRSVFNAPLSINAVTSPPGFAAVADIEPPFVFTAPLIVNRRAELSGDRVVRLTSPPFVLIASETVMAPVLIMLTSSPVLPCVTPVTVNSAELFVNEMAPLPVFVALKLVTVFMLVFNTVPPTELVVNNPALIAPFCVIAPVAFNVKLPPMLEAANNRAPLLLKVALFAPLLFKVTAPVKLLFVPLVVKSIAFAPALKLAVPGTVSAPV